MNKILKPYTIIPPSLYIQREADRQLNHILSDMGRPGYVLVSRQMGKTNLLLNAKRNFESNDDLFVYVDLSNSYPNAKSCFENIIDLAIETNLDKLGEIGKIINERRLELVDTPPHKQHTNELRMLLKVLHGGKLVIMLDEIDALTKSNYSDQIFSQIRSTYFGGRINYSEFNNLTYILSGVAEPSEIIKDPKISPFNIGQKIYLNDFSKGEFMKFIQLSKIDIRDEVVERIFFWTNGNPRMTWDICSEIENIIVDREINSEVVDKAVHELYLKAFDKPPIDNIREIVSNDKELRNAIIEIEYKKGKEVSARIKSKLYLTGIINYNDNDIVIKNRIIKEAINLDWIKSLEDDEKNLFIKAITLYEKSEYDEAIKVFERLPLEADANDEDRSLYFHYLGISYYKMANYAKAIECLDQAKFDTEDQPVFYYRGLNFKGTAYYKLQKIDESLNCLRIIINSGRKDIEYSQALINYGITILNKPTKENQEEAISIFKGIVDETTIKKEKLTPDFVNVLKFTAHLYLAKISSIKNEKENAILNYKKSIEFASDTNKPATILSLIDVTDSKEEKYTYLLELVNLIEKDIISPSHSEYENSINFDHNQLKEIFVRSFKDYRDDLFARLKPKLSLLGEKSLPEHLYELALYSINNNKDWETTMHLLNEGLDEIKLDDSPTNIPAKYRILKLTSYLVEVNSLNSPHYEYTKLFASHRADGIDFMDMQIFVSSIFYLSETRRYKEAYELSKIIEDAKDSIPEIYLINLVLVYHLQLNILKNLFDGAAAIDKANQIIEFAKDERLVDKKSDLLGENGLDIIVKQADAVLHPVVRNTIPIRVEKTPGRNDVVKVRYKDGTIRETKFKKVEEDLKSGECYILT